VVEIIVLYTQPYKLLTLNINRVEITLSSLFYLIFVGCTKTLAASNGTLYSPNYPRKYPDGQYCSWRITVSSEKQIHLTFTDFDLQSEKNTDALYVYDGQTADGKVLGVFYGDHPPPKE